MLKKIILLLCFLPLSRVMAQEPGPKAGWSVNDRRDFFYSCVEEAAHNFSRDTARYYCFCMQAAMETRFPKIEDAAKVNADELNSPAFEANARECIMGKWPAAEKEAFMKDCVQSAFENLKDTAKSQVYCSCMMFKLEKKYPDIEQLLAVFNESFMESDFFKEILKNCLEFL